MPEFWQIELESTKLLDELLVQRNNKEESRCLFCRYEFLYGMRKREEDPYVAENINLDVGECEITKIPVMLPEKLFHRLEEFGQIDRQTKILNRVPDIMLTRDQSSETLMTSECQHP